MIAPRDLLLRCYRAALEAVDARACVREHLARRPLPEARWHLVAIGKAAGAMAQGAVEALGPRLAGGCVVVPPRHLPAGFAPESHGLEVLTGAHPVPDDRSLAAGARVAAYVAGLGTDDALLFLVSGGASSLVESLRPGCTLADLQHLNRWAQGAGIPIARLNTWRRRLSQLKGGGLATLAGPRRALALMVSDVQGDDPCVIGSGLLHAAPDESDAGGPETLPTSLQAVLARMPPARAPGAVPRVPVRVVATLRQARAAAAGEGVRHGVEVRVAARRLDGDAAALGRRLAARIATAPEGTLMVWGGEPTVQLPDTPGRGGRCQQLALAAALEFERRRDATSCLLAAGTDGIDGASTDAGAIVDATSCVRGRDAGFDPHVSLAAADSGSFLEAAGDLLHTGPTLTNVGDLVLGLRVQGAR